MINKHVEIKVELRLCYSNRVVSPVKIRVQLSLLLRKIIQLIMSYFTLLSLSLYVSYSLTWCVCFSKVKELEEELHVVTNSLRSLEISENKVCGGQLTTLCVIDVKQSPQSKNLNKVFRLWSLLGQQSLNHSL